MTYASASDVAMYCRQLLQNGEFTETSIPRESDVEVFLGRGYSIINTTLASRGYSTPVDGDADAYDYVVDLEAKYAAARAHTVRMTARTGPGEDTKAEVYDRQFQEGLDRLLTMDLSRAGVTHTSKLYAGGISESDKDTYEGDTDRVKPRFVRDQFRHPDSGRPGAAAVSEADEY